MIIGTITLIALIVYFVPAAIALNRNAVHKGGIVFLDLLAGWTIIGWVAAFIWACVSPIDTSTPITQEEISKELDTIYPGRVAKREAIPGSRVIPIGRN